VIKSPFDLILSPLIETFFDLLVVLDPLLSLLIFSRVARREADEFIVDAVFWSWSLIFSYSALPKFWMDGRGSSETCKL